MQSFLFRQLQEKYFTVGKQIYIVIVDLEKAFKRVPKKVIWWTIRKVVLQEWIVNLVQGMYENVQRCVRAGEAFSDEFEGRLVYTRSLCSVHCSSSLCLMLCHSRWEGSSCLSLQGNGGDALDRDNYRGLKLMEQAMKVIERIAYSLVRQVMTIDWSTLGGPLRRWHSHYCILHGRICP